ncbi:inner-membrane translocator [Streptomyces sp. DT2A-34]|uniref:inner-membrane translocator n=1 Tax=Streptomyces sp. DT2A-34 TaxID=3051182 RepID=UPI00265BB950|nr:inner-membrane translocator [Streptomyces sp. DT2A-34]MDO0910953.1 inner-membrane translocator [Streptomyces sp. DT2A-34]
MPERADGNSALTGGCLLFLILVADVAAALLAAIVIAARRLGRTNAYSGTPSPDWTPVLGFGALTLALGVTAVVLLRIGHGGIGALQLTLCGFLAVHTLEYWP